MSIQPAADEPDADEPAVRSYAFYIRLWREPTRMSHGPVWRGSIQAAADRGPRYFSSVDELHTLVVRFVGDSPWSAGAAQPHEQAGDTAH